ncbi:hypothetical protein [Methanoregula sp.]|uniref:hypothetical protein n=1 Tax=Methanoregula sp. TaxID=2052170 RepID=UPI003C1FA09F
MNCRALLPCRLALLHTRPPGRSRTPATGNPTMLATVFGSCMYVAGLVCNAGVSGELTV